MRAVVVLPQPLSPTMPSVSPRRRTKSISVAERSFPLLNLVEMLGQPCLQSVLYGWRQLQDHLDKTQGLKDFTVTPSIHDNMRPLGAQLLKGDRLARLVRKTRTGLCVGKQMIQTVA